MTTNNVFAWSGTAGSNADVAGNGITGSSNISLGNDVFQNIMAQITNGMITRGSDIATASTVDFTAATTPSLLHDLTGTTTVTAVTMTAGWWRLCRAQGAFQLTASSTLVVNGSTSTNYTTTAGDLLIFFGYSASTVRVWTFSGGAGLPLGGGTMTGPLINTNTAAGIAQIQAISTDAGASIGPIVNLYRNSASPAVSDLIGSIQFDGVDSAASQQRYASISTTILDPTAATRSGALFLNTALSGTIANRVGIAAGLYTINATGGDKGADTINASTYYKGGNYGVVTLGTVVNTTSGTAVDVTGIPAGVRRVCIHLNGVSVNAAGAVILQLGNGSIVTTGYNGNSVVTGASTLTTAGFTTGFCFSGASTGNATSPVYGTLVLSLIDATNNVWACGGWNGQPAVTGINVTGGEKALSSALDRIRLTTVAGTATFNAGSINISYE